MCEPVRLNTKLTEMFWRVRGQSGSVARTKYKGCTLEQLLQAYAELEQDAPKKMSVRERAWMEGEMSLLTELIETKARRAARAQENA